MPGPGDTGAAEELSPHTSTAEPSLSGPGAASPEPVRQRLRGTATEPVPREPALHERSRHEDKACLPQRGAAPAHCS